MAQRPAFPRAHLLILGPNSIQSLLPVTPTSQADALLESHQIEDVIQLADQQRKKVQGKLVVDPYEVGPAPSCPVACLRSVLSSRRQVNSRTSTRKSGSGVCSRRGSRTPVSASSRGSSTRAYSSRTSPTSAAHSSMRIQPLTCSQALPNACRPTIQSTTLVRPLFLAPAPPRIRTTAMTRLPLLAANV
jgi:hypothetical protein